MWRHLEVALQRATGAAGSRGGAEAELERLQELAQLLCSCVGEEALLQGCAPELRDAMAGAARGAVQG
jgi:hypothetical protein